MEKNIFLFFIKNVKQIRVNFRLISNEFKLKSTKLLITLLERKINYEYYYDIYVFNYISVFTS